MLAKILRIRRDNNIDLLPRHSNIYQIEVSKIELIELNHTNYGDLDKIYLLILKVLVHLLVLDYRIFFFVKNISKHSMKYVSLQYVQV